jgi:succinate dehydrogenase / fumarate reductase iron-sulfur subunit
VCGSDALVINGRNRLACKELVQDVGKHITVEPLRGLPVIKDLAVDMEPFFRKYRRIQPFLMNDEPPPYTERLQSPEARARFDETTKCILCAACTTSCPSFWADDSYVGPAAIVQAHRFIFDDRDQGAQVRLAILAESDGVWRCRTIYNCVQACPRDIDVTRAIGEVKKALLTGVVD